MTGERRHRLAFKIVLGVAAGFTASIPQVLSTQLVSRSLGLPAARADIGPRFVRRVDQHLDAGLRSREHWLIAAAFHFGYAVVWGMSYALLQRWRPAQPHVGGPLLGALIYLAAFSPWGVATQTGAERPVEARPGRESVLHWTAALSFSLGLAYLYDRFDPVDQRRSGSN